MSCAIAIPEGSCGARSEQAQQASGPLNKEKEKERERDAGRPQRSEVCVHPPVSVFGFSVSLQSRQAQAHVGSHIISRTECGTLRGDNPPMISIHLWASAVNFDFFILCFGLLYSQHQLHFHPFLCQAQETSSPSLGKLRQADANTIKGKGGEAWLANPPPMCSVQIWAIWKIHFLHFFFRSQYALRSHPSLCQAQETSSPSLGKLRQADANTKGDGEGAWIAPEKRPIVLVGPYEHHSNEVMWRETIADVCASSHMCVRAHGDTFVVLLSTASAHT